MKKLTAGIFAGILTIVTVNAADAAITSKAYVDNLNTATNALVTQNKTDITNLTTTVTQNKIAADNAISGLTTVVGATANDGLQKKVADLQASVGEGGSVADQIATELGKLDVENTLTAGQVATSVAQADGKIVVSGALISNANVAADAAIADTKIDFSEAHTAALDSGITAAGVAQIGTNKSDIAAMDTAYKAADKAIADQIGAGFTAEKTVAKAIEEAKTAASTGLTDKLGDLGDGNETVADALAEKANINATVAGNMITTDANGQITALNPTESEAGTYVLTATVADGKTTYFWENIQRAETASTAD